MPVTIFLSHLFFPTDNLSIIINQFFIVVYMCQKPSMNVQKSKPSNYYNWLLWILWCFILIYEKVARVTNITFNLKKKKMAPKVLMKSLQTPRCDIYPRTIVKVQPNTCPNKNQEGTWKFHHKWSAGLWDCYNKTLKIGHCYYIEVSRVKYFYLNMVSTT